VVAKKPWSVGVLDVAESLLLSCETDTLSGAMVVADGSTDEEACADSEYAGRGGISDLVRASQLNLSTRGFKIRTFSQYLRYSRLDASFEYDS
jgi:hypothetical protein